MSTQESRAWPTATLAEDFPADMELQKIPQPPTSLFGLLGNLPDIDPEFQGGSFWRLHELYGNIYQLVVPNRKFVVVSGYEYVHQVTDDETTEKVVFAALKVLRTMLNDGLFSAFPGEKGWGIAHRLLVPVFGPLGVKKMLPPMADIASQLILKWDRAGPETALDVSEDFTRLTFDTIGICAFNFRFNQFYKENLHPFANQMAEVLKEAGRIANRTSIETSFRRWSTAKFQEDMKQMQGVVDEIIHDRQRNPRPEIKDLLNVMLEAVDPVTGEKMSHESIRGNMLTFLIAGHETTSGTLSFLFYELLKHPDKLHKVQKEVDDVVGDDVIDNKHIPKLVYMLAAIHETMRLHSPLTSISRKPKKDLILSGKYKIPADTGITINLQGLHTDPEVWGPDAKEFKPERWINPTFPSDAWRPFGVGMRACIGRFFAEQEMLLNVALILQRFQVEMADPSYDLVLKVTGTIKPEGFRMKVRRRPGKHIMVGLAGNTNISDPAEVKHAAGHKAEAKNRLVVLYGSNAGTCKTLAEDMESSAPEHGFAAQVMSLDQATENIPSDAPVIVVTSSYEGKPTDNAKKFVSWLESKAKDESGLKNTHFAVFGVGNTEWAATYQKIPKTIEGLMKAQGAQPICEPFFSDVKVDTTGDWEKWTDILWKSLKTAGQGGEAEHKSELKAEIIRHDAPAILAGEELSWGVVKSARSLGGLQVGLEKRELTVQLPTGVTYRTGDYLSVSPMNHPDTVQRALNRFGLHVDDLISVSGTRKGFLKSDQPVNASIFMGQRVELNAPATQKQIETLAEYTKDDGEHAAILELAEPQHFAKEVLAKNYSVLDILEDRPSVALPLSKYLDMLKPLMPRQYSISSSPLRQNLITPVTNGQIAAGSLPGPLATIVYDVQAAPARSGGGRSFHGVASSYMARLQAGARIHCNVRSTNAAFHLPEDPAVPLILVAAGTGLSPMRGFIQERMAIAAAGARKLGPALLYFGCRDYKYDNIYADELDEAQKAGVVQVRRTFSRRGPPEDIQGHKYVYERISADRDEIAGLFRQGAKIFLCGSASGLAKSTAETLKNIYRERNPDKSERDADQWLASIKETRYVADVFD